MNECIVILFNEEILIDREEINVSFVIVAGSVCCRVTIYAYVLVELIELSAA